VSKNALDFWIQKRIWYWRKPRDFLHSHWNAWSLWYS